MYCHELAGRRRVVVHREVVVEAVDVAVVLRVAHARVGEEVEVGAGLQVEAREVLLEEAT